MIPVNGGGGWFASIPGDPGQVRAAAARIGRLSGQIGTHGTAVSRGAGALVGSDWRGQAASRFEGTTGRLAAVHTDVEDVMGTLPGAFSAYADALEMAQHQMARAEQMMQDAEDSVTSSLAVLSSVPAQADAASGQHHQAAVSSINRAYQAQSAAASNLAGAAVAEHQAALTRLTSHVQRVADEGRGVQLALTRIGDSLGVPVAVLSALSAIAMLRAAGRFATVGSAFAATAVQEGDELTRFLGAALYRGDIRAEQAVDRIVSFVDHTELASQIFANDAKADLGAGGLLDLGRFTGAAKWVGRGAGVLAILGDTYTVWHPDEGGAWGDAERGVAVANGVGTGGLLAVDGFGLAEGGAVLAADASLGWVPVAGQVLVIGSGLYLMGSYLYAHARWFHDGIEGVGHGLADAGEAIGHGTVAAANAVGTGFNEAGRAVDTGLTDAGNAVSTGLGDTGRALGSAAHSVAGFFGL